MNRGIAHSDVFLSDDDRVSFGQQLADIHTRFGVEIHAYCLMDNHYHLLVHCPDGQLSAAMQRLGSVYTRHVNDRVGRDGPLFRGRFHSRSVISDEQLLATVRYIHRNPLDLPGVSDLGQYRWSSHRTYLGHRRIPPWMRIDVALGFFGDDPVAFDGFVRDEELVTSTEVVTPDDLRRLVQSVGFVLAQRDPDQGGRLGSHAKAAVIVWATDTADVGDEALTEAFGLSGAGALRSARSRARRLVVADAGLAAAVDRAVALCLDRSVSTGV